MLLKIAMQGRNDKAKSKLKNWDYRLDSHSIAAAIYTAFEKALEELAHEKLVPEKVQPFIQRINLIKIIDWLNEPTLENFGNDPEKARTTLLTQAFQQGVESLTQKLSRHDFMAIWTSQRNMLTLSIPWVNGRQENSETFNLARSKVNANNWLYRLRL